MTTVVAIGDIHVDHIAFQILPVWNRHPRPENRVFQRPSSLTVRKGRTRCHVVLSSATVEDSLRVWGIPNLGNLGSYLRVSIILVGEYYGEQANR